MRCRIDGLIPKSQIRIGIGLDITLVSLISHSISGLSVYLYVGFWFCAGGGGGDSAGAGGGIIWIETAVGSLGGAPVPWR